jgi:serine/threonine protein phosphatase 1
MLFVFFVAIIPCMRTIVVGDIHGKLSLLNRLIEETGYKPGADRLVLIGDLVDRGENARGVVARAIELRKEAPDLVTVLKGNHEEMMLDSLVEGDTCAAEVWYYNGGIETLQSYRGEDGVLTIPPEHIDFLSNLPTWHEDEHAIYVHAGLVEAKDGTFVHPQETPDDPELLWARNRRFFNEYSGKTVVFGHTITGLVFGERQKVYLRDNLIGIDTGAYLTGTLSAIELPSRQLFSVFEEAAPEPPKRRRLLHRN